MEKYAKLMKGLEICAGPDCSTECPYHGVHAAGRTCRSWLLSDAAAAIANEEAGSETLQELLHNTEAERDKLAADVDHLEAENNAYRTERDALRDGLDNLGKAYKNLCSVRDGLNAENNALHDEIDALVRKIGKQEEKTDRPSACDKELMEEVGKLIGQAKYQEGRADALAAIVERCSFGGGCRHE